MLIQLRALLDKICRALGYVRMGAAGAPPEIDVFQAKRNFADLVYEHFPNMKCYWGDDANETWTCDEEDMAEAVAYFMTDNRSYLSQRFDCENFAEELSHELAKNYGINRKMHVWGKSPMGYHGFSLIGVGEDGLIMIEPQNGNIVTVEDGYIPEIGFQS